MVKASCNWDNWDRFNLVPPVEEKHPTIDEFHPVQPLSNLAPLNPKTKTTNPGVIFPPLLPGPLRLGDSLSNDSLFVNLNTSDKTQSLNNELFLPHALSTSSYTCSFPQQYPTDPLSPVVGSQKQQNFTNDLDPCCTDLLQLSPSEHNVSKSNVSSPINLSKNTSGFIDLDEVLGAPVQNNPSNSFVWPQQDDSMPFFFVSAVQTPMILTDQELKLDRPKSPTNVLSIIGAQNPTNLGYHFMGDDHYTAPTTTSTLPMWNLPPSPPIQLQPISQLPIIQPNLPTPALILPVAAAEPRVALKKARSTVSSVTSAPNQSPYPTLNSIDTHEYTDDISTPANGSRRQNSRFAPNQSPTSDNDTTARRITRSTRLRFTQRNEQPNLPALSIATTTAVTQQPTAATYSHPQPNQSDTEHSDVDDIIMRREKNKIAARKSRENKRLLQEEKNRYHQNLEIENAALKKEVQQLKEQLRALQQQPSTKTNSRRK